MSLTAVVEQRNPDGKPLLLPCANCNRETSHDVLTHINVSDGCEDTQEQTWDDFHTVQCGGCKTTSFCINSASSSDLEPDPHDGSPRLVVTTNVYPRRIAGRARMRNLWPVPAGVRRVYIETHDAICNRQPVLAGIGTRAIVEAVCKEKNAAGGNLEK